MQELWKKDLPSEPEIRWFFFLLLPSQPHWVWEVLLREQKTPTQPGQQAEAPLKHLDVALQCHHHSPTRLPSHGNVLIPGLLIQEGGEDSTMGAQLHHSPAGSWRDPCIPAHVRGQWGSSLCSVPEQRWARLSRWQEYACKCQLWPGLPPEGTKGVLRMG